jgi:hypothetical protein
MLHAHTHTRYTSNTSGINMQAYWLTLLYEEELGLYKENLYRFLKTNRLSTNNTEKMFRYLKSTPTVIYYFLPVGKVVISCPPRLLRL